MRRGEVWWAKLPGRAGRRPVLTVMRDEAYPVRQLVIVAPLTTRRRELPVEVPLTKKADGVPKRCVVNLDTLTTIPRKLLTRRIAALSPEKMAAVDEALSFALGLD